MAADTPALIGESLGRADEHLVRTTVAELAGRLGESDTAGKATVILFGPLGKGLA